ncbi:MAG TPA: late competence development ComFB family protein [Spirochaetota bacterium]|nr:late competence development ComFB family protein [Spirochaetota bacterium]HPI90778.1 late competence development ComFB family protein [Spirochaetota bacterium]HPR47501.1 late competence development ComFB family protein [Spirochaetota bacterium]
MTIRNLMEDVVIDMVNEIVNNDKDLSLKETKKDDIMAYVLNRIPQKYVTSERGIIHGMLDAKYVTQQKSDILFLIYEAISVIKNRRGSQSDGDTGQSKGISTLPHVMGEVLEETTFSIIPDVEVTLLYKNKKAPMIDEGWKNPYTTNRATRGYYHFWPAVLGAKKGRGEAHAFTLKFSHPKFEDKEVEVSIDMLGGDEVSGSRLLPIVLLKAKSGVDIDFLYNG